MKKIIVILLLFILILSACSTFSGTSKEIKAYRSLTDRNPILTHTFGADPCVLVYNDRVYIYLTGDTLEYERNTIKNNSYSTINTLRVISSRDLANWTYHEPIKAAGAEGIAKWAERSWAPDITYKKVNGKDKFFLYFSNNANGVGVLTADDPLGPWTDPIGEALVSRETANCSDIPWVFDPAVFIDDDGKGYLYFGGGVPQGKAANPGTTRVVALNDDMISLANNPITIDAPFFFEASSMNKIDGRYIFSYCTNWQADNARGIGNAVIAMMSSNSPLGPFTPEGTILKNPGSFFGVWGNNHHTVFEFKDKWYITYHSQILEEKMGIRGKGYRAPHIDNVTIKDGKIQPVKATRKGVEQIEPLNPYDWQKGATSGISAGLSFEFEHAIVTKDGSWLGIYGADFGLGQGGAGASSLVINARAREEMSEYKIEVRLDSPAGRTIGTFNSELTPSFTNYTIQLTETVNNVHDVYFIFREGNLDFGGWQFK